MFLDVVNRLVAISSADIITKVLSFLRIGFQTQISQKQNIGCFRPDKWYAIKSLISLL